MHIRLHGNATTTPAIRKQIYEQRHRPTAVLQREFGLTYKTIKRWKASADGQDGSSRPKVLNTSFADWQEALIVELRKDLLLPLDDLLVLVREFLLPSCSRSALLRLLKRHGVNDVRALYPVTEEAYPAKGKGQFPDYPVGYLHVDIKYLPKMQGEKAQSYLFVAIDRATRWVFAHIYSAKTAANAADFIAKLHTAFPATIHTILTDNGKEFTNRFTRAGERTPDGSHPFDTQCNTLMIKHKLTQPRTPQTNGMVERFNGRIADLLKKHRVEHAQELHHLILHYIQSYNNIIPQRKLNYKTPKQALDDHHINQPILTKPDNYITFYPSQKRWIKSESALLSIPVSSTQTR
jgi:transposase InsO family protein